MLFDRIVRDIKSLKIQGAQAVARQSLLAVEDILRHSRAGTAAGLAKELAKARALLEGTRPTEPCMRNALRLALGGPHASDVQEMKRGVRRNIDAARAHFDIAGRRIADFGAKKVQQDMVIYTHCHSSTVVRILETAKRAGRRFSVHNTETRPSFQGRITAEQLARLRIPVEHYVDSAARYALRKADLVLLGVDAVTSEGAVVNKIGTRIMVELAQHHDIPVYFCTDSWKLDPRTFDGVEEEIEVRDPEEVWPGRPKGVTVRNYAFESVGPELVSGIISELGIFRPGVFIEEAKDAYPWLFR